MDVRCSKWVDIAEILTISQLNLKTNSLEHKVGH